MKYAAKCLLARERVVVTGMGPVTSIGSSNDKLAESLRRGVSGTDKLTRFDTSRYDVHHAGEIKDFNLLDFCPDMKTKDIRRLAIVSQYALAAAEMAIKDSGLVVGVNADSHDVAVRLGAGVGGLNEIELQHTILKEAESDGTQKEVARGITPFLVPMIIPDAAASNISLRHKIKGEAVSVNSACSSSLTAICDAYDKIKLGNYSVVITGGAEAPITPITLGAFSQANALSKIGKSRPYDKERDGFVISEGAGILILENLEHALNRNAKIYGEILGYGASSDAHNIVAPDPDGDELLYAIEKAMDKSGIYRFDYINTHGTSTKYNDKIEAAVINYLFGGLIPVSSTKSMTGHSLGASAAIESITTLLSMKNRIIYPTINYENMDPECKIDCVPNAARHKELNTALKFSSGFGGHNAAIIFGKYPGK
ncbi:MAG: beta-ketoacyl-[acyl-carrier-protein] synthase family protein [Nanoarchaeota archaeon]